MKKPQTNLRTLNDPKIAKMSPQLKKQETHQQLLTQMAQEAHTNQTKNLGPRSSPPQDNTIPLLILTRRHRHEQWAQQLRPLLPPLLPDLPLEPPLLHPAPQLHPLDLLQLHQLPLMPENDLEQLWQPPSEGLTPVEEAHQEETPEEEEEEADHQDCQDKDP